MLVAATANLALLVLLAYAFRLGLAVVLWFAFGKAEYTDDIQLHLGLAADPFAWALCKAPVTSQQPPLLGALETTLLPFTALLGQFFGPRAAYAAWDVLGSLILVRALGKRGWDTPWLRVLLFFGPVNIYASVVSVQDEVLAYCFACVVAALLISRRDGWAFVVASFGVIAVKILFVPMAAALAPFMATRRRWPFLVGGSGLVLGTYWWGAHCDYPPSRFVLAAPHTVSFWQVFVDWSWQDWSRTFRLSAVLVMVIGAVLYGAAAIRRQRDGRLPVRLEPPEPVQGFLILVLTFLGFFYHVVPEYFLVAVPFAVIYLKRRDAAPRTMFGWLGVAMALPVVPDVLRYFVRFHLGPAWLTVPHQLGCVLVTVACLLVAVTLVTAGRPDEARRPT